MPITSSQNRYKRPSSVADSDKSEEEIIEEMKRYFEMFDLDGTGEINANALNSLLKAMGKPHGKERVDAIMEAVDADGSGTIDLEEFLQVACPTLNGEGADDDDEMKELFQYFDLDKDGQISIDELEHVMNDTFQIGLSKQDIQAMVFFADKTGSGKVTFEEFKAVLQSDKFNGKQVIQEERNKKMKAKRRSLIERQNSKVKSESKQKHPHDSSSFFVTEMTI